MTGVLLAALALAAGSPAPDPPGIVLDRGRGADPRRHSVVVYFATNPYHGQGCAAFEQPAEGATCPVLDSGPVVLRRPPR